MTNFEIYRRTMKFSLMKLLVGLIGFLLFGLITFAGFWFTKSNTDLCVWVTLVCLIVGIIVGSLVSRYLGYLYRAGQIAVIAKGVTENDLPDDVMGTAKEMVSKRFVTANVFFAIQSALSAISQQITRGITGAAGALGKMTGSEGGDNAVQSVGAAISAFISIVLEYVTYCCLGWVFVNPGQNAFKSACDGAVMYFQNWKTLLKNAGKILGITILSLLAIGGALFAAIYACVKNLPYLISAEELAQIDANLDPQTLRLILVGVAAVALWALLHAAFVKPFLLVSAMRSYMDAARKTTPAIDVYDKLCSLSPRFRKTYQKASDEA